MSLRFADLNPLGRVIIVAVAGLTLGVAAVAFATSYGALYAFIKNTGLYADTGRYADRLNQAWPLLLDATFIVAQLAAILAGILRGSRGWPILTMLLTGALTVWFNLQHAGADPGRRLAAALPPVLMMLAFEIDISIVKWVMRALGKPMEAATPLPPTGMLASPVPGAIWRPDGLGWNAPYPAPQAGWPAGLAGSIRAGHHLPENPHNGQAGLPVGDGGDPVGVTKRARIEAHLDRLGSEQLRHLTLRELTSDLNQHGLDVTERYVKQVIDQRRPASPQPRRRGSGGRTPRR
jgi:peptidoglycan/LPS O-acetylase OafA/YrhL